MYHKNNYYSFWHNDNHIIHTHKNSDFKALYKELRNKGLTLVKMKQTHSSTIQIINDNDNNKPIIRLSDTDAIITKNKSLALIVKTADCVPVLISHPSGYMAAIHAGRVGTENKILGKTLQLLIQKTQSTQKFHIYLGPHICENCYEINPQTKDPYSLIKKKLEQIQEHLSILKNTLSLSNCCTKCHPNFHSYRETKTKQRIFSIIINIKI